MKVSQRIFTLEEINSLLPQLEELIIRINEKKDAYERKHDELLMHELLAGAESHRGAYNSSLMIEDDAQALDHSMAELKKELDSIRKLGCIVRNIERGSIDFLGNLGGQTVFFCWHCGEKEIRYYHSREAECAKSERRNLQP